MNVVIKDFMSLLPNQQKTVVSNLGLTPYSHLMGMSNFEYTRKSLQALKKHGTLLSLEEEVKKVKGRS